MDLLHTLLSYVASLITALTIGFNVFIGGVLPNTRISIVPPTPLPSSATSVTQANPSVSTSTATSTKTTPKKVVTKPKTTAVSVKTPPEPAPQPPRAAITPEVLNTQTREALVNILCMVKSRGQLHSISGTGVFIDSRGVILTNAHIGQYFLLKDYPTADSVDCSIRIGSPAQPRYRATLLYLPPAWITDNASQIIAEQGMGTGEHDYAFLLITGTTGPGALPTSFPHLSMTLESPEQGASAFLAAYPAGFLDSITIERNLYTTAAYATVTKLYTFSDAGTIDLVSIGGTVVSQGGSSGGAMVRTQDGALQGIIAVETPAETTALRDLRALTLGHINRSLISQGQKGIMSLLTQDLAATAATFASTIAPSEKAELVKVMEGTN